MYQRGFIGTLFCAMTTSSLRTTTLALTGCAVFTSDAFAQPPVRRIPPAPLGVPNVAVGPTANPYGTPPVAVGPAPMSDPLVSPLPPPGFSAGPGPYPMGPNMMRRPSPFLPAPGQPVFLQPGLAAAPFAPAAPIVEEAPTPIGNIRFSVSESFLNRLVARNETRPGEVRDFILGAEVFGHQTTATKVRLDLLPGGTQGRAVLVLNGTTQSETTGFTPQAKVDVASQQEFVATKEIYFDGEKFSTRHAVVHVRAKNQTLGATTPLTGTLFGGIANRIAFREAERRRPQAEAVARDRVAERVFPEFDKTIDKQLADANDQLELTVRKWLGAADLLPSQQLVHTSDTQLSYFMQVTGQTPTESTTELENRLGPENGLKLMVHEGLLNSLVGRLGLKGLRTTDKEMEKSMAPYAVKPEKDELDSSQPPPISLPGLQNIVIDIEFDDEDPLTIRLEDDRALVTLRAKFKPAGNDVLPPLAVTIPYSTKISGEKIVVTPGKAQVEPLSKGGTRLPDVALKVISNAIDTNSTSFAFDRALPASFWPLPGPVPRVVGIHSQDGWGGISID